MARNFAKQINDSRRSGRELAEAFIAGAQPTQLATRLTLRQGEFCVAETQVIVHQWLEGDGEYVHKSGGYVGGGVVGMVALRGAKAVGNARRKAKAARESSATWREVDRGTLFITNYRFAVQGRQWSDLWFESIRMADTDSRSITLHVEGTEPLMLELEYADYWYVMFQKVAYNQHYMPQPLDDEELRAPVQQAYIERPPATYAEDGLVLVGQGSSVVQASVVPEALAGRWEGTDTSRLFVISRDGYYSLAVEQAQPERGVVKVDGSTLVLEADERQSAYQWLLDEPELVLISRDGPVVRYRKARE